MNVPTPVEVDQKAREYYARKDALVQATLTARIVNTNEGTRR